MSGNLKLENNYPIIKQKLTEIIAGYTGSFSLTDVTNQLSDFISENFPDLAAISYHIAEGYVEAFERWSTVSPFTITQAKYRVLEEQIRFFIPDVENSSDLEAVAENTLTNLSRAALAGKLRELLHRWRQAFENYKLAYEVEEKFAESLLAAFARYPQCKTLGEIYTAIREESKRGRP